MVILLTFFMIAVIVLFIAKTRHPSSCWMSLILLGWSFSMSGLVLFISKYGGFYYKVNLILFLSDTIRRFLLELPVSIDLISRLISIGRSLFIFGLVGLGIFLYYRHNKRKMWILNYCNGFFSFLNIFLYDPYIYKNVFGFLEKPYLFLISLATRGWLVLSALIAFYLMTKGYNKISIPTVKTKLRSFYPGILVLTLFYFYLGFMGPLQVTDVRTYYYLYRDFTNLNPPLSLIEWYFGVIFTGITSLVSIFSIWRFTDIDIQIGRKELQMEKKFKYANTGATIFTHAIKNQLVMSKIILNKSCELLQSNDLNSTKDELKEQIFNLNQIITDTLTRLDELYKSFKNQTLQLKSFFLTDLLNMVSANIKTIPSNITFKSNYHDEPWEILADPERLTEALTNIIINAFEAIKNNNNGIVEVDYIVEDSWCIIKIKDNGCGISPNQLKKIFDPFYTNKNTTKNWGIGLSYTQKIVKEHFGYIYVESEVGSGTVFKILLPIYRPNST